MPNPAICPNIPMRPDDSIEADCIRMLEAVVQWMDINGRAIYGSKAWVTLGEGEMVNGRLRKLPGGGLGKLKWRQSDEALEIQCPASLPCTTALAFRIN